jgi:hypothetical protein
MTHPDAVQTLIPREGAGAQARAFAEKGDPLAPGVCLWCGDKLRLAKIANHPTIDTHREARGDYGDNAFCGIRCGYAFGLRLACIGSRLRAKV